MALIFIQDSASNNYSDTRNVCSVIDLQTYGGIFADSNLFQVTSSFHKLDLVVTFTTLLKANDYQLPENIERVHQTSNGHAFDSPLYIFTSRHIK